VKFCPKFLLHIAATHLGNNGFIATTLIVVSICTLHSAVVYTVVSIHLTVRPYHIALLHFEWDSLVLPLTLGYLAMVGWGPTCNERVLRELK
jgi:hypothetical protein